MLDRPHRAFDLQRRFIANASHELRTPPAISRTAIEMTLARPGTPPETTALGHQLLVTNDRQVRLIDGLLTLARSERAPTPTTCGACCPAPRATRRPIRTPRW